MQDRYVGDIGDFGKYGLLRHLSIQEKLKIGVLWLLTVPDRKEVRDYKGDGTHTGYLGSDDGILEKCDSMLFASLKKLVERDKRNTKEIQKSRILPLSTRYFSEDFTVSVKHISERESVREALISKAMNDFRKMDMIFFDPDNGIASLKKRKRAKNAGKYIFRDEIKRFFDAGKTVLVYQHGTRKPWNEIINNLKDLRSYLSAKAIVVFKHHRVVPRHYICISNERHDKKIRSAVSSFEKTAWCAIKNKHFSIEWV